MTVLLNVRLLCTSPFSPSVCASQPPFLDIHPTPLHPQTAPTVRGGGEKKEEKEGGEKKPERTEHFQTRRHKSHTLSSLLSFPTLPPPLLLQTDFIHFIPPCANARDHTETKDFLPSSMKRTGRSSAIQHRRPSHQHEHWIHMLQQKLLARELTNFGPQIQRRGESQF